MSNVSPGGRMSWVDWIIPLPGLVFLFTVIGPLPDRWRESVGGVVTWVWFALLLVAFVVSGPKFGLLAAVVGSVVLGCLMQPLSNALIHRRLPGGAQNPPQAVRPPSRGSP